MAIHRTDGTRPAIELQHEGVVMSEPLVATCDAIDLDEARRHELLVAAVDHAERYLAQVPTAPTWCPALPVDAWARLSVPDRGRPIPEVMAVVDEVVARSGVATTSPRYLGYLPSGGLFAAAVGDFLAGVSNRYTGLAQLAPGAAALEATVVRWLADVVGYSREAAGTLTSGGSLATLTAVVAARDHCELDPAHAADAVVYVGEHTHHCVAKALGVAGLSRVVRRVVPSDHRQRMDPGALAQLVALDRAQGRRPWLLVGTAGTTSTGSVDPLAELAEVAGTERLWFHLDGAYGALFALCENGRTVLNGLERADTMVVDPHKTLFLPYGSGAVLARSGSTLDDAFAATADYLGEHGDDVTSPSDLDLELTRPFRGMRLWLPLQLAGSAAFAAALSEKLDLARYAHDRLAETPGVVVGPQPDLTIVTLRCRADGATGDDATAALADDLQQQGRVYLTTTRVGGRLVLRLAIGSFRTHREHVDEAIEAVADHILRLDAA
jgi:aromatic-L-amino-acid/L-tryptophan decarboxylase